MRTRLSSAHALARLEWFSSYLSATCLLKTEGKDLIFPLDLVPSFLCILRKNGHLHLHFQGLQEGGGGKDFPTKEPVVLFKAWADAC